MSKRREIEPEEIYANMVRSRRLAAFGRSLSSCALYVICAAAIACALFIFMEAIT